MGFELRQFATKSKFNKWFQKGKFRSYYRVRFGQIVIEARRIAEERPPFFVKGTISASGVTEIKFDGGIELEKMDTTNTPG